MRVSIERNLQGPLEIVDLPLMKQGTSLCGYVKNYRDDGQVVKRGSIHIDLERVTANNIDGTADTLIHEASHKFVLAKDHAYRHEIAKYSNLKASEAMDNADCIAGFALMALQNHLN